jgi:hypothetical protein
VLVSHRDDLAVISGDLVQVGHALDERCPVRRRGLRAVIGEREHRDGLALGREHVYPLVTILKRQVDERVPGYASPRCKHEPG